jgi:hypothetical protein
MNEQRLKGEGATAYSGGVASADSLGAGRSGVALVFVSVCGELHGWTASLPRTAIITYKTHVLLVVVVGLVQCNAAAVSIAFGPWDSTGLSAIQLKP